MKFWVQAIISGLAGLCFLAACDLTGGVGDTTKHMDGTLGDMETKISEMSDQITAMAKELTKTNRNMFELIELTTELQSLTAELRSLTVEADTATAAVLREERAGVSQQSRRDAFELIRNDDLPLEAKIKDAAVYFQSFEFQLWEGILDDDSDKRYELFGAAMTEFLLSFRGLIDGKRPDPDVVNPNSKMESLLALAFASDQVNELQNWAARKSGFPMVSALDLILLGLAAKPEMEGKGLGKWDIHKLGGGKDGKGGKEGPEKPGKEVPDFVGVVLASEEEAKYLLQLRYNILPAISLDRLSNSKEASLGKKITLLLNMIHLRDHWDSDLGLLNANQLDQMTGFLDQARALRPYLAAFHVSQKLDSNLLTLLRNVRLIDDASATASTAKKDCIDRFKAALNSFLSDASS